MDRISKASVYSRYLSLSSGRIRAPPFRRSAYEKQVVDYLLDQDINVMGCDLLTTYEHARSLTYKLLVAPCDREKVKDLSLWPQNISGGK